MAGACPCGARGRHPPRSSVVEVVASFQASETDRVSSEQRIVPSPSSLDLLRRATGFRHGIVPPAATVPLSAADVPDVHHASVLVEEGEISSAAGGVARDRRAAEAAALGEALERYAAALTPLWTCPASQLDESASAVPLNEWTLHSESQRRSTGFPFSEGYPPDPDMSQVFRLVDNAPHWVPAALVGLSPRFGPLSTSSGLAADFSVYRALLRALQELIERDSLMITWLHGLGGRRVRTEGLGDQIEDLGGTIVAYDLTPEYSPHPVALVAGMLPLRGHPRHSVGVACRSTWTDALEKARLEFVQGVLFAGHYVAQHPELAGCAPDAVTGFDTHAAYYTANPTRWQTLPIHAQAVDVDAPIAGEVAAPADEVQQLCQALDGFGFRLYYRELSTVDVRQLGLRVVRVLSPDLTPIHHDHRWPFLGGTTADVRRRYTWAESAEPWIPSPHPHALG